MFALDASGWYEGPNPFKLATPSPWWLRLLTTYDDQLVLIPSQTEAAYRLTRKVTREGRMGLNKMVVHEHPDTKLFINLGVVPMSTVLPWAIQSDKIIRDLAARDLWAQGGSEKALDRLEAAERADLVRQQRRDDADLDAVNSEAFRSLQTRKGERISMTDVQRGRRGSTQTPNRVRFAMRDHKTVISPRTPVAAQTPSVPRIVLADR